ncbi:hypothetical protein MMC07_003856 [Pseudocyphellaria aurata]|nr:hypothetical protein [Pseudocyphellaria aurata]
MSLNVKHINGDTTFLLAFSPLQEFPPSPCFQQPPGQFSILVDPWLSGPSLMWHAKFLLSKHTVPPCINNLSHIPEPNVVLVSQDKPDHCHEETLRQLDPSSTHTTILAEPAAAKKIRGMKHFNTAHIHALPAFSHRKPESIVRFFIPPLTTGGLSGEVTIAFIPSKLDVSGLHNAIGITYRPPTTSYLNPTRFPSPLPSSYTTSESSKPSSRPQNFPPTPPESPLATSNFSSTDSTAVTSPNSSCWSHSHASLSMSTSSTTSTPYAHIPAQKTISVIYSPHGVSYPPIRDYASSHLVSSAALPLTAFLHSFDRVQNPWWLGGNINAGLPGGVEIAKSLMTKCWVGAHDEDKENSGFSVIRAATRKYNRAEVQEMVGKETQVEELGVGEELVLRA